MSFCSSPDDDDGPMLLQMDSPQRQRKETFSAMECAARDAARQVYAKQPAKIIASIVCPNTTICPTAYDAVPVPLKKHKPSSGCNSSSMNKRGRPRQFPLGQKTYDRRKEAVQTQCERIELQEAHIKKLEAVIESQMIGTTNDTATTSALLECREELLARTKHYEAEYEKFISVLHVLTAKAAEQTANLEDTIHLHEMWYKSVFGKAIVYNNDNNTTDNLIKAKVLKSALREALEKKKPPPHLSVHVNPTPGVSWMPVDEKTKLSRLSMCVIPSASCTLVPTEEKKKPHLSVCATSSTSVFDPDLGESIAALGHIVAMKTDVFIPLKPQLDLICTEFKARIFQQDADSKTRRDEKDATQEKLQTLYKEHCELRDTITGLGRALRIKTNPETSLAEQVGFMHEQYKSKVDVHVEQIQKLKQEHTVEREQFQEKLQTLYKEHCVLRENSKSPPKKETVQQDSLYKEYSVFKSELVKIAVEYKCQVGCLNKQAGRKELVCALASRLESLAGATDVSHR